MSTDPPSEQVEAVAEPTLEQCERLAATLGFPLLPESLRPPYYAESLRNLHALAVKMLNGDEQAERTINTLRLAFGSRAARPSS